jgi:hypothetical protein
MSGKIVDAFEGWDDRAQTNRIYLVREVNGESDDGTPMPSFSRCDATESALYQAAVVACSISTWTGADGLLGIPDAILAKRAASAVRKALRRKP